MSVNLVKGQKISLSKEVNGLEKVVVGLGWDAAKKDYLVEHLILIVMLQRLF